LIVCKFAHEIDSPDFLHLSTTGGISGFEIFAHRFRAC